MFFFVSLKTEIQGHKRENCRGIINFLLPSTSEAFTLHLKKQGRLHGNSGSVRVDRGSGKANQVFG